LLYRAIPCLVHCILGRIARMEYIDAMQPVTDATRVDATRVVFSARCNIYISRLCYDVSVRLSVRLSVMEVHWCIIANLGFKFRSQFNTHCGRGACGHEGMDHRREEWRDHLALC